MPTILEPQPNDPNARLVARLRAAEARLSALERRQVVLPKTNGAPDDTGPDGLAAIDNGATPRIWVRVNGAWFHVTLS